MARQGNGEPASVIHVKERIQDVVAGTRVGNASAITRNVGSGVPSACWSVDTSDF